MLRPEKLRFFLVLVIAAVVAGCAASGAKKKPAAPFAQVFEARGVVKELPADGKTAVIAHEKIPGYMDAMTMPFPVKDKKELAGLQAGDTVTFQMVVSPREGWISKIKKVAAASINESAMNMPLGLRVVPDREPLKEGDVLPNFTFTNELGQAVSLAQFRGQALAITFIFTRCPFPNFCPRMTLNFDEVQTKMKALENAPANWHLLTLSFDPENDTPAVLKEYAERYNYDPAHWSFLTGAPADISAFTEPVGLQFWRENPGEPISHNLRTVVVDAQGRITKILANNDWTSDELVPEIVKAALARP